MGYLYIPYLPIFTLLGNNASFVFVSRDQGRNGPIGINPGISR